MKFEGEGTEKECGTVRKHPSLWGEVELGALKRPRADPQPRENLQGVSARALLTQGKGQIS